MSLKCLHCRNTKLESKANWTQWSFSLTEWGNQKDGPNIKERTPYLCLQLSAWVCCGSGRLLGRRLQRSPERSQRDPTACLFWVPLYWNKQLIFGNWNLFSLTPNAQCQIAAACNRAHNTGSNLWSLVWSPARDKVLSHSWMDLCVGQLLFNSTMTHAIFGVKASLVTYVHQ